MKYSTLYKLAPLAITLMLASSSCLSPNAEVTSSGGGEDSGSSGNVIGGDAGQVGSNNCSTPFIREVTPIEINAGKHLYFRILDFAFLADPQLEIQSITLDAVVRGRQKGELNELTLSFNGTQASCGELDGYQVLQYIESLDQSSTRFNLHKHKLNGGISFKAFALKVYDNKGLLRVSLHGKNAFIESAKLTFSGYRYASCPVPSPSPSPVVVAPSTSIVSVEPPGAVLSSSAISIAFASNQAGVQFHCSLDGGAEELCSSPIAYSNLSNGAHIFRVHATNSAGLRDSVGASHSFTVDTLAPVIAIDGIEYLPSITSASVVTLNLVSNETGYFLCSLDGAAFATCAATNSYSGLADGQHEFRALFQDLAGNISESSANYQWVIDSVAPVASITQVVPSQPVINSSVVDIQFTANESANFECALDGSSFAACESPASLSSLGEGLHQFVVRATDSAGNVGIEASYSFNVDLTAPIVTLGSVVPAQGVTNSRDVSVEFSASEASVLLCSLDGAAEAECSSPFTAELASEGAHSVSIRARDLAGNVSASVSVSWTADFSAPVLSFGEILPSAASQIKSASLSAQVVSSESANLSATLDGTSLGSVGSLIELSGLAEGAHVLVVTASDTAGNASASISHSFEVDLSAPAISLAAAISGATRQTANSFTFSASESANFECELNGAGFAACQSPLAVAGLADGSHQFRVRASDGAGNSSIASAYWSVDTVAPLVTITSVVQGSSASFTFSANESVTGYECSLDGSAFSPCVSPRNYTLADGQHSFSVRAADLVGNVSLTGSTHNFTVVTDSTGPVVTYGPVTVSATTITVNWYTNEPATSQVLWGVGISPANINRSTIETSFYTTVHSVRIGGLSPNTTYIFRANGRDQAGNVYQLAPTRTARTSN